MPSVHGPTPCSGAQFNSRLPQAPEANIACVCGGVGGRGGDGGQGGEQVLGAGWEEMLGNLPML